MSSFNYAAAASGRRHKGRTKAGSQVSSTIHLHMRRTLGATGAKLMTTMLHELERTGGRYGLQTICEAGGMANAVIIERLG